MDFFQAIFLGFIQGLTEFLPISSSGHLIFLPKLFHWTDQGLSFDVVVHLGSLLAVIFFFRKKIFTLLKALFSRTQELKLERNLAYLLILSIIPAGIFGLVASDWIEATLRSAHFVAFGLIFWGIILLAADRYNNYLDKQNKNLVSLNNTGWKRTLFIACAQAIALLPGTSRSGITMTAGLFAKLDKKAAAEFSFLMSIPVIALAGLVKVFQMVETGGGDIGLTFLIAGFVSAAVSGFLAIQLLMKIIEKWNFVPFVVYRIIVGVLILLFI